MIKYFSELDSKQKIKVMDINTNIVSDEILPTCYYINPNNNLYNGMSDESHKEANLKYTFKIIEDYIYDVKYKSLFSSDSTISLESLLKEEMDNYQRIKNSRILRREDVKVYLNMCVYGLSDPTVINLILGIIESKIIVLNKFIKFVKLYPNKREMYEKLLNDSCNDISDILIRYCGFHKVLSVMDKTIVTSSLNFSNFIEYLDLDWSIVNLPMLLEEDNLLHRSIAYESFIEKHPEYENNINIKTLSLK